MAYLLIEELSYLRGRFVDSGERLEQGSFVVQSGTGISDKDRRNTKDILIDKRRRRRIPSSIAASLEGIADTAIGEARSIGFLLY